MRNFVQSGNTVTMTAPAGGIASGSGLVAGDLFGIAVTSAEEGGAFEASLTGVFDLPKANGAIGAGAKVYWDAANGRVTTTASGNKLIGAAIIAADAAAAVASVRLNGVTL